MYVAVTPLNLNMGDLGIGPVINSIGSCPILTSRIVNLGGRGFL